jgi:hypothetical protein
MTDKRYRVREHISKETITDKTISIYYTIEKLKKRYFNLFGPDVWVTLKETSINDAYDYIYTYKKWNDLNKVKLECERLNNNLPTSYTETSIIDNNKLFEKKVSNPITVDEEELFEILTRTYISIKEDYDEFEADCDRELLEKIHKFMGKNYLVRYNNFRLQQDGGSYFTDSK